MKAIWNKGTLVMAIVFITTLILALTDPFNLDPEGIESTSAIKAVYVIPAFVFMYFYFMKPTIKK